MWNFNFKKFLKDNEKKIIFDTFCTIYAFRLGQDAVETTRDIFPVHGIDATSKKDW